MWKNSIVYVYNREILWSRSIIGKLCGLKNNNLLIIILKLKKSNKSNYVQFRVLIISISLFSFT